MDHNLTETISWTKEGSVTSYNYELYEKVFYCVMKTF
jgi:hypothetical protein